MIGLVSCTAMKLDRAAPARELYTSQLFRSSLRYLEPRCEHVFVLSALHGLVELDRVLAPYDHRLRRDERREWAKRVRDDLVARHPTHHSISRSKIVALAGANYTGPLAAALEDTHLWLAEPLHGMMIGERLSWLSRANMAGVA